MSSCARAAQTTSVDVQRAERDSASERARAVVRRRLRRAAQQARRWSQKSVAINPRAKNRCIARSRLSSSRMSSLTRVCRLIRATIAAPAPRALCALCAAFSSTANTRDAQLSVVELTGNDCEAIESQSTATIRRARFNSAASSWRLVFFASSSLKRANRRLALLAAMAAARMS